MKKTAKRFLGIVTAFALVIGVSTSVLSRSEFGPSWGGHQGIMGGSDGMHDPGGAPGWMMSEDPVAYTDRRLIKMKTTLGITSDQKKHWNIYEQAMKGRTAMMFSHQQVMITSGVMAPDQHSAYHQLGLEQMKEVTTASRNLYEVLTPEQQAKAGNLIALHRGL